MNIDEIIKTLKTETNERTKKQYMNNGAKEPLYGLTVKSMKPLAKKLLKQEDCQSIAYELYDTGNYDLMYLAGMIVDAKHMPAEKYNEWIDAAYFYMISDFIVAVCLSEADIAYDLALEWIASKEDLKISAGYNTYSWMLARKKDDTFNEGQLIKMLDEIKENIDQAPNRTKYAMYYFVYNVAVSYVALHDQAYKIAKEIGSVDIVDGQGKIKSYNVQKDIEREIDKNRIGFKRKYVRC